MTTFTPLRCLGTLLALAIGSLVATPAHVTAQATSTVSPVVVFGTSNQVAGAWSRLSRNETGITMQIHTSGLEPGAAYTVWWVIFNNPEFCVNGCGGDDLTRLDVQAAAGFAAGHVIGNNGRTNFGGHLNVGDVSGFVPPSGVPILGVPPFGPGLLNPLGAEVHLVIRTHGPAIPSFLPEQIQSFNAACPPNTCMNRQASIHK